MKGQRIAIIGGSAGIGLALARQAVESGATVVLGARNRHALEKVAASLNAEWAVIDTMNEESVAGFFRKFGSFDHLATPGASVRVGAFRSTSTDDFLFTLQNKLVGQMLCAKNASIREGGSITFFSGILARRPGPWPLLASVNAAIETLAQGLAVELKPLRVNAVSPGLTRNTNAFNGMTQAERESMFEKAASRLPLGRVGEPEDSAAAALFLMQNSFITGQVIAMDGGATVI